MQFAEPIPKTHEFLTPIGRLAMTPDTASREILGASLSCRPGLRYNLGSQSNVLQNGLQKRLISIFSRSRLAVSAWG
jgi:hypothetical protein